MEGGEVIRGETVWHHTVSCQRGGEGARRAGPPLTTVHGVEPLTDADREVTRRLIQDALARDELAFEQIDERFAAIYAAQRREDLDAVIADLPTPPPPVPVPVPRSHPAANSWSIFGNVERGGNLEIDGPLSCNSVFGNVVIDLSSARMVEGAVVQGGSVFGDVTVILPDGLRVRHESFTVFGDQKERLTPPADGAPTITVNGRTIFGNAAIYSLSQVPEGRLRRLWKAFRSL